MKKQLIPIKYEGYFAVLVSIFFRMENEKGDFLGFTSPSCILYLFDTTMKVSARQSGEDGIKSINDWLIKLVVKQTRKISSWVQLLTSFE